MRKTPFITCLPLLFVTLVGFTAPAVTQAKEPPNYRALQKDYRQFLMRLGFEDYSNMVRENRKRNTGAGAASEYVLKFNQGRYGIVNFSRELAILLALKLEQAEGAEAAALKEKLARLTARLFSLRPMEPPTKFPDSVLSVKASELEEAKIQYLVDVTKQNIREHTDTVLSDLYETLYGEEALKTTLATEGPTKEALLKELHRIRGLVERIVEFTYLDSELGQTRYLGRALATSLIRHARLRGDAEFEKTLKAAVKREGLRLENFVGDTLSFTDKDGRTHRLKIENGDFLNERSIGPEAGEITWGARPGLSNTLRAARMRLLGNIWGLILPKEDFESAQLGAVDYARMRLSEKRFATKGFSHVGMANVLEDAETGIKMTWALDNYPNAMEGGIRISGILEQFAPAGEYMRLGVSRYDPKKFWDFAQSQIKEHGHQEIAWIGEKEFLDEDGETIETARSEPDPWKTTISKEEFERLHSAPRSQAAEWYREVMRRTTDHIRHKMLAEDGVGFAYGFSNYKGRLYCSLTVLMASLQATGLELQPVQDRWNIIMRVMKLFNAGPVKDMNLDVRIIAPSGFLWQPLVDKKYFVEYPYMTPYERARAIMSPQILAMNPKMTRLLSKLVEAAGIDETRIAVYEDELMEKIEASLQGEITKRQKSAATSQHAGAPSTSGYVSACSRLLK
ncbi:MAG: hypothetical protein HYW49_08350 [Deltaproteobacteria bacterium]|nr:hypothetical protein [Deltaproteobacteria bacterium]